MAMLVIKLIKNLDEWSKKTENPIKHRKLLTELCIYSFFVWPKARFLVKIHNFFSFHHPLYMNLLGNIFSFFSRLFNRCKYIFAW